MIIRSPLVQQQQVPTQPTRHHAEWWAQFLAKLYLYAESTCVEIARNGDICRVLTCERCEKSDKNISIECYEIYLLKRRGWRTFKLVWREWCRSRIVKVLARAIDILWPNQMQLIIFADYVLNAITVNQRWIVMTQTTKSSSHSQNDFANIGGVHITSGHTFRVRWRPLPCDIPFKTSPSNHKNDRNAFK